MSPAWLSLLLLAFVAVAILIARNRNKRGSMANPITVQIDGDSIVYGLGVEHSIPERLKEWHPDWVIDDRGVSGLKLWQLVAGYQEPYVDAPEEVYPRGPQLPYAQVARSSQVVVLALGVNDALEMRTAEQFEADLRSAIQILSAEARTVIVAGIVNFPTGPVFTEEIHKRRDEFQAISQRVARELMLQRAGWGNTEVVLSQTLDGVHPTQEESDRLGRLLAATIMRAT